MSKPLPTWIDDIASLRDFARIRLMVIDIDGSMLEEGSSKVFEVTHLIRSLNHPRHRVKLTVATGRTLYGVMSVLKQLPLHGGTPLILYNGSVVVTNKTYSLIRRKVIANTDLGRIVKVAFSRGLTVLAYHYPQQILKCCPHQPCSPPDEIVYGWSKRHSPGIDFNGMAIRWQETESVDWAADVSAILIGDSTVHTDVAEVITEISRIADVSVTRSGKNFAEVRPAGSNKAQALMLVANLLSCSQEQVLAFGDNDNDAEMLAWAGIGVAVAGSSPLARDSSDYFCKYGAAHGAVQVMRLVREARHYFFQPERGM